MLQNDFKENFLEIEERLFQKKQSQNKKRLIGLFFGILLFLIVVGYLFLKKEDSFPIISKKIKQEPIFFWQLNLADKDLEDWLEQDQNRQNLLNFFYKWLGEKIGQGAENLFKQEIFLIQNSQKETFFLTKIQDQAEAEEVLKGLEVPGSLGQDYEYLDYRISSLRLKPEIFSSNLARQEIFYSFLGDSLIMSSDLEALKKMIEPGIEFVFPGQSLLTKMIEKPFIKLYLATNLMNQDKLDSAVFSRKMANLWTFILKEFEFLVFKSSRVKKDKLIFNFKSQELAAKEENQVELPLDWLNYVPKERVLIIFSPETSQLFSFEENPYFKEATQEWRDLYSFTWADFTFLGGKNLIILRPKNKIFSLNKKDFDYIAVFENKNNFTWESKEFSKIEGLSKQILSYKFPEEVKSKLPDNSEVIEYLANPEIFSFEFKDFANFRLKFIRKPSFEFAYSLDKDKIFLSNSLALLEKSLVNSQILGSNQSFAVKETFKDCFKDWGKEFIYWNLGEDFKRQFGLDKLIINSEKACIY